MLQIISHLPEIESRSPVRLAAIVSCGDGTHGVVRRWKVEERNLFWEST